MEECEVKRLSAFVYLFFCLAAVASLAQTMAVPQANPSATTNPAQLKAKLQQKLDEWRAAGKFPGATAGVALADGTTFGLATGVSDLAANKPMTPNDRLLQGSVGKTYVS